MPVRVTVLGAGFAGCEAALWLAANGADVTLIEQKPVCYSPAHKSADLAEPVCSNSFKALRVDSAAGLLKEEMRRLGSHLVPLAEENAVPAGGALAVDRMAFSAAVTTAVEACPNICLVREEARAVPREGIVIVATGPLTEGALAEDIAALCGGRPLSFYDAAAPIIEADSIDRGQVFAAARYGRGEADYLNCAFDREGYEVFWQALVEAEGAPLHEVDDPRVYEGCMPLEVLAKRGPDTLRFGPLRPVGLTNPRTGHRPWACVQLRQENAEKTLYNLVGFQTNLKFGEQQRVFSLIPGLANARFARFGVMHRNSFLNSPRLLSGDLSLKATPNILFAGQITGFEGYMESAACGLLAARSALAKAQGRAFMPPPQGSMCGALLGYITAPNKDFQPMGANMGLLPPLPEKVKDKRLRYAQAAQRALAELDGWIAHSGRIADNKRAQAPRK